MSEESKTADADYVMMGSEGIGRSSKKIGLKLDDPNLSQEEKDHRLAIALQQQENAAAYAVHQKKHEEYVKAQEHRTARSGTYSKLAAVRDKDSGMLMVPSEYSSDHAYKKSSDYLPPGGNNGFVAPGPGAHPQEIADFKIAAEMQKVEQVDAGTVRTMQKIVKEEVEEEQAQKHRTERSNYHIPQKGLFKK